MVPFQNVTSMQVFQFKEEVMEFLASLCSHAIEKSPLQPLFARCLKCSSPNYMVESSRSCELILGKLVSYKQLPGRKADTSKLGVEISCQLQWKRTRISLSNLTKKMIVLILLFGSFFLILTNLLCYQSYLKCWWYCPMVKLPLKRDLVLMVNFWLKIFTQEV